MLNQCIKMLAVWVMKELQVPCWCWAWWLEPWRIWARSKPHTFDDQRNTRGFVPLSPRRSSSKLRSLGGRSPVIHGKHGGTKCGNSCSSWIAGDLLNIKLATSILKLFNPRHASVEYHWTMILWVQINPLDPNKPTILFDFLGYEELGLRVFYSYVESWMMNTILCPWIILCAGAPELWQCTPGLDSSFLYWSALVKHYQPWANH